MLLGLSSLVSQLPLAGRALLAAATAWAVCLLCGPHVLRVLRRMNVREATEKTPIEQDELRRRIESKSGTPTMGGLILLPGFAVGCLLWADAANAYVVVALAVAAALGAVGMLDDQMKLRGLGAWGRGLKVQHKLLLQGAIGLVAGLIMARHLGTAAHQGLPESLVPALQRLAWPFAVTFAAWAALVLATMSNATNITDGLDGLLSGLAAMAAAALGTASLAAGKHVPGAEEMSVVCGALGGACLGFLWFNRHPARVFMGDTGSLAVGGVLAVAALVARREGLLAVIGIVFLSEFASSVLQRGWFKVFRRRILPIAPIHHIFEERGTAEPRIVRGFYLWGAAAAVVALHLMRL